MKYTEELLYKANFKIISDWLEDLTKKSIEKKNNHFTNECLKIQELLLENVVLANEQCNEERLLNNVILEQGIELLKKG